MTDKDSRLGDDLKQLSRSIRPPDMTSRILAQIARDETDGWSRHTPEHRVKSAAAGVGNSWWVAAGLVTIAAVVSLQGTASGGESFLPVTSLLGRPTLLPHTLPHLLGTVLAVTLYLVGLLRPASVSRRS